jgi:hypothetical protein
VFIVRLSGGKHDIADAAIREQIRPENGLGSFDEIRNCPFRLLDAAQTGKTRGQIDAHFDVAQIGKAPF